MAYKVYLATRKFPQEEKFGITSQLRRAVLSVPTNIVEGYSRKGDKELANFINIALGSMAETKYLLRFSNKLEYLQDAGYNEIIDGYNVLGKKTWKFYQAVKKT